MIRAVKYEGGNRRGLPGRRRCLGLWCGLDILRVHLVRARVLGARARALDFG